MTREVGDAEGSLPRVLIADGPALDKVLTFQDQNGFQVAVEFWTDGQIDVITRSERAAIWGPPLQLIREEPGR